MNEYVLDASALLALLNGEAGADAVQEMLPHAVLSAVNLAEGSARLAAAGMPEKEIRQVFGLLGLETVPFDEETAIESGLLHRATHSAGLSLGDRACLALAKTLGRVAVTADHAWQQVEVGVEIRLIR